MQYEYAVIPAPAKGEKSKGSKTPTDRYAVAFASELNRMAEEGWDYVRAETLPSEERSGLTGRSVVYHNLLVFRRVLAAKTQPVAPAAELPAPEQPAAAPAPAEAPKPAAPISQPAKAPAPAGNSAPAAPDTPDKS